MTADLRYRRRPGVVWRSFADVVLVRTVGDRTLDAEAQLTGSAAVVWLLLDRPCSGSMLVAGLRDGGVPELVAEAEAAKALDLLAEHGLVERLGA